MFQKIVLGSFFTSVANADAVHPWWENTDDAESICLESNPEFCLRQLQKGTGNESPLPNTPCDCHYTGKSKKRILKIVFWKNWNFAIFSFKFCQFCWFFYFSYFFSEIVFFLILCFRLLDGTKFDSSRDRGAPTKFAPNQVIKGWTEAMQMMVIDFQKFSN